MKKLVLIFAAVIMLAGGTVSVLQWLQIGPFAPKDTTAEAAKAPASPPAPPVMVDLEVMSIPLFHEDKVVTTIQIQLKLEVPKAQEGAVQKAMPRITDAVIKELHAYLPRALTKSDRIDLGALKTRMLGAIERKLGPGLVDNVLVGSINDIARPPESPDGKAQPKAAPYGMTQPTAPMPPPLKK